MDGPASTMEKPCGALGHGCETPDPQQDSSPRRCQKRAQGCYRNSIFGTAKYKYKAYKAIEGKYTRHTRQSHRCLDGPASTMEKPCGGLWGMVAKQGNPSQIQAQGGARSVRRGCSRNSIFRTAKYKAIQIKYTRQTR